MKASIGSSAQCRSSTTSTAGPSAARPSRNSRQAEKFSSREASSASRPRSGRRRLAQAVAVLAFGQHGLEARLAARDAVALEDAGRAAHDLGERPEGHVRSEGQAAALAPGDGRGGSSRRRANSASRRLLPMPGSPQIRPNCGLRPSVAASTSFCSSVELLLAADEGGGERAQLRAGARQGGGREPGVERLTLALERDGVAGVEREDVFSVAACVDSPTATAIGGAADCRRAATFTASPVRKPSPEPGSTSRRTRASPVLTPTRTSTAWPAMPGRASTSSTRRRPARTARSGSSSCSVGTPKTATTASPMNFSTVPP